MFSPFRGWCAPAAAAAKNDDDDDIPDAVAAELEEETSRPSALDIDAHNRRVAERKRLHDERTFLVQYDLRLAIRDKLEGVIAKDKKVAYDNAVRSMTEFTGFAIAVFPRNRHAADIVSAPQQCKGARGYRVHTKMQKDTVINKRQAIEFEWIGGDQLPEVLYSAV